MTPSPSSLCLNPPTDYLFDKIQSGNHIIIDFRTITTSSHKAAFFLPMFFSPICTPAPQATVSQAPAGFRRHHLQWTHLWWTPVCPTGGRLSSWWPGAARTTWSLVSVEIVVDFREIAIPRVLLSAANFSKKNQKKQCGVLNVVCS